MAKILVVEDEKDLATLLQFNLESAQHTVATEGTAAGGLQRARTFQPDLVLLDLMLPDLPGTEVLRLLKADPAFRRTAVFMLTAKGQEEDRIRGFELGADDYLAKPFSVRELLLRVQAVLRRFAADTEGTEVVTLGPITLDVNRHQVRVDGQELFLTALEFRLLRILMERRGRVQTREMLLADVWKIEADITTRTVDTHIRRLRDKLGAAGDLVETMRGVGYRMSDPAEG